MGMVKNFLWAYCVAMHPDDEEAQDALFAELVEEKKNPPIEEMKKVIENYKRDHPDFTS